MSPRPLMFPEKRTVEELSRTATSVVVLSAPWKFPTIPISPVAGAVHRATPFSPFGPGWSTIIPGGAVIDPHLFTVLVVFARADGTASPRFSYQPPSPAQPNQGFVTDVWVKRIRGEPRVSVYPYDHWPFGLEAIEKSANASASGVCPKTTPAENSD